MKSLQALFITTLILSTALVDAKTQSSMARNKRVAQAHKLQTQKMNSKNKMGAQLGTDFQFNDLSVRGQYQSALEGKVTVENEKELEDLLDYRTNYQDRLAIAKGQR